MMRQSDSDIVVVDPRKHDLKAIYAFYQTKAERHTPFVVLREPEFLEVYRDAVMLVHRQEEVDGLLIGSLTTDKAYLSFCLGADDVRRRLIERFETLVRESGLTSIWIHFFNPILTAWWVKPGVTHPMYQGVELDGVDHRFYASLGYRDHSMQETYYRTLSDWVPSDAITARLEQERANGLVVCISDATHRDALMVFANEVGHPGWQRAILDHLDHPFVIALAGERVVGFAGPLWVEPTGRGYFAGIGVLERYRGHGLGKGLFQMLLWWHQEHGASYMTLFTGRDNPAGRIYLEQGFEIVKRFMTLKKELK